MAKKIPLKHSESGMIQNGAYGFSWTYLFFGWMVPLIRGELGVAALHLLFSIVTFWLWQLIAAFLYNKQYMTRMLTNGWELAGSEAQNLSAKASLNIT